MTEAAALKAPFALHFQFSAHRSLWAPAHKRNDRMTSSASVPINSAADDIAWQPQHALATLVDYSRVHI